MKNDTPDPNRVHGTAQKKSIANQPLKYALAISFLSVTCGFPFVPSVIVLKQTPTATMKVASIQKEMALNNKE